MTNGLLNLLELHGGADLERAIAEAVVRERPHVNAVKQVLAELLEERGKQPPVQVRLPNDPRVKDLVVRPHRLETYDVLERSDDDEPDTQQQ
jgi:hypothetical protein